MFSLQKFTCFLKQIVLLKKEKEIIRIFILKTSNVRTKYIYTLDKNKNKNQYACSGIFKV